MFTRMGFNFVNAFFQAFMYEGAKENGNDQPVLLVMSCPFVFTLFLAFCIFATVLSGKTDILLRPEVYSAVITELKLVCKFVHMYQELY